MRVSRANRALHTGPGRSRKRHRECARSEQPSLVHFAGHGGESGIVAFDRELALSQLKTVLGAHAARLKVVVLNVCDTAELAVGLSEHVAAAIGMRGPIRNSEATRFAQVFYRASATVAPSSKRSSSRAISSRSAPTFRCWPSRARIRRAVRGRSTPRPRKQLNAGGAQLLSAVALPQRRRLARVGRAGIQRPAVGGGAGRRRSAASRVEASRGAAGVQRCQRSRARRQLTVAAPRSRARSSSAKSRAAQASRFRLPHGPGGGRQRAVRARGSTRAAHACGSRRSRPARTS